MLYKLLSTYELLLKSEDFNKPVRIEVFQSTNDSKYRVRVWVRNTYNLYPTLMNINDKGDDLHAIHSSDDINQEITSLIFEDSTILSGQNFNSEDELIQYVKTRINSFFKSL